MTMVDQKERQIGVILSYANILIHNLIVLLYTPILLNCLGQVQFGLYQLSYSVISSLAILSLGFGSAYIRFFSLMNAQQDEEGIKKLNGMYLLLFTGMAFLAVICGFFLVFNVQNLFSNTFTSEEIALTRTLMILMVINVAISFPSSVFDSFIMAKQKFIFQRLRQLLQTLFAPLLTLPFLFLGYGAVAVVTVITLMTVLFLVLNTFFAIVKLRMTFKFNGFNVNLLKDITVFSSWIFLNQIFDILNNNAPNFILGILSGAKDIAVFAIAMQIKNVFASISVALSGVYVPLINELVANNTDRFELTKIMTKVGRYQMIMHCFFLGGFIVVGEYFINLWAGSEYSVSYWLVLIMVVPAIISYTQNTGIEIQRAMNKHRFRSILYFVLAIINIIISVILIPRIGVFGPAVGYLFYVLIGVGLIMNWYYHKHIGIDILYFWRKNIPIFLTMVASVIVILIYEQSVPVQTFGDFIITGLLYSLLFSFIILKFVLNFKL